MDEGKAHEIYKKIFKGESDPVVVVTNNELYGLDQTEFTFLQRYRETFLKTSQPYMEGIPSHPYIAEKVMALKNKFIVPVYNPDTVTKIIGPTIHSGAIHEDLRSFPNGCVRTISTYPQRNERGRDGDPICDVYGIYLFANRAIAVVADGCNWGEAPKNAALIARNTMMEFILERQHNIFTVEDAQVLLLRALCMAQRRVAENNLNTGLNGSTTILAGIKLQIDGTNEWAFVCVSLGDCKAFLLESDTLRVRDITENSRKRSDSSLDASDCGGRLGSVDADGSPDLRNISTYIASCQPGDTIFLVSDGVHDNLHPAFLGIEPRQLKLDFDNWETVAQYLDVEKIALDYRVFLLNCTIGDYEDTPENMVTKLLDYVVQITESSRKWMELNQGKRLPCDYKLYPGKMDHTTCMVFTVGPMDSPRSRSMSYIDYCNNNLNQFIVPIVVTLTVNANSLTVCCKTIAKGKFECTAKKNGCVITVTPKNPVKLLKNEVIIGEDETSAPYSRIVSFPPGVAVNIHSKKVNFNSKLGTVFIRFDRE